MYFIIGDILRFWVYSLQIYQIGSCDANDVLFSDQLYLN
jgi:hypothetical protein